MRLGSGVVGIASSGLESETCELVNCGTGVRAAAELIIDEVSEHADPGDLQHLEALVGLARVEVEAGNDLLHQEGRG